MQTITIGKTRYTTRRTDIFAHHAKCTGKHRRVKSKGTEKRFYPANGHEMSTFDYIGIYEAMNKDFHIGAWRWQPMSEHITQPEGQDIFEVEA